MKRFALKFTSFSVKINDYVDDFFSEQYCVSDLVEISRGCTVCWSEDSSLEAALKVGGLLLPQRFNGNQIQQVS